MGSRWRRLPPGRQALLVLAHLRKGETYTALAGGFGVGTTTVFRYVREGIDVLAAVAPTLDQALDIARRKAFVILDGTLLSIDRVGMAGIRPRLLLRQAQATRGERPGPRRPGRSSGVGLGRAARGTPRHVRRPGACPGSRRVRRPRVRRPRVRCAHGGRRARRDTVTWRAFGPQNDYRPYNDGRTQPRETARRSAQPHPLPPATAPRRCSGPVSRYQPGGARFGDAGSVQVEGVRAGHRDRQVDQPLLQVAGVRGRAGPDQRGARDRGRVGHRHGQRRVP